MAAIVQINAAPTKLAPSSLLIQHPNLSPSLPVIRKQLSVCLVLQKLARRFLLLNSLPQVPVRVHLLRVGEAASRNTTIQCDKNISERRFT